ncbi:MAG TPA: hypothetical protein VNQ79_11700, partial [Blastocatellia bacterium]|nr:hypothetical protein [Blastocatellia bacterium]
VSSVTHCKFIAPTSLLLKPGPTLQQPTVRSEVRETNSRTGTPIIHCTCLSADMAGARESWRVVFFNDYTRAR